MSPRIDLTGQRFSSVVAVRLTDITTTQGKKKWECLCDCGKTCYLTIDRLRNTGTKTKPSCGCMTGQNRQEGLRNRTLQKDLSGLKVGRVTVLNFAGFKEVNSVKPHYIATWNCICECSVEKIIPANILLRKSNKIISCGCYNTELRTTHGLSKSSVYHSYTAMIDRCYNLRNLRYSDWGGRGITVCQRWLDSVENFLEDMGEKPLDYSIERVNVNGNYEPSNCIWLKNKLQARNRVNTVLNQEIVDKMRHYQNGVMSTFKDTYTILKQEYPNISKPALSQAWRGSTWK